MPRRAIFNQFPTKSSPCVPGKTPGDTVPLMTRQLLTIDAAGNIANPDGSPWASWAARWTPSTTAPRVLTTSAKPSEDERQWAAWSPAARAEFLGRCDDADATFRAAGQTLCILPHAADPLSDVPGVLTFLRQRGTSNVRVVLDPALLLTASMIANAEDHLARAILSIGQMPGLEAIILRNIQPTDDGSFESVPLEAGILPAALLLGPAKQLPPSVPIAVLAADSGSVASRAD